MTITYSFDHVPTTVEDVSIEVAPKSEMTLRQTYTDPKTGEVTSEYVLASGDDSYPATIIFRSALQNRSGGARRRLSVQYTTWASASNDVDGTVTKQSVVGSIQFLIPGDMTIEVADLDDFLGVLFSSMYPSVTTKVRSTAWLQKLLYGVPQVV